ncbi:H-NS histone family protein [Azoarcus sp. TTM-91]|uniref:H-NS histone family protein n=1 Tax=Azoarcus sp. TTM-91 TaxID=2691581 RepID=UPI0032B7477D
MTSLCSLTPRSLPNDNVGKTTMDLSTYTLPQLKQLQGRIDKAIARQQADLKGTLRKRLDKIAREHGLSLEELVAGTGDIVDARPPVQRAPVAAKYRHPSNRDLAWSGRGRTPHWVTAYLANGGTMDALAIAAEKLAPRLPRSAAR